MAGEFALVLHTHMPHVRGHGTWPVGEEWLFQAWGESWLRVTEVLLRLAEDGHREVLTLGVTPLAAAQLADPRLRRDLGTWLAIQMWRAEEQRALHGRLGPEVVALGSYYWRYYADLLALHEAVEQRGGLLAVWAELAREGVIELLGGPATHPYLPLMADPGYIDAQLEVGLDSHVRWAGERPRGLWAPECGYRPRGPVADPTAEPVAVDGHGTPVLPRDGPELPGLEEFYQRHGITHVLMDAATVVRAAGGRDRDWTRRPEVAAPGSPEDVVHDGVWIGDSEVVAFARDLAVAYHVWSPHAGYPGDPVYRDFYARGGFGLHPSWRVTDKALPPTAKQPYDPGAARARVTDHVDHLHRVLREVLDPRPGGLVVAAYDTELFGHWWFEGPWWLEGLLRRIAADPALRTTTLRSRLERRPPRRRLLLPESSWGYAKGHASWVTPRTRPMWAAVRAAERRFGELRAVPHPPGLAHLQAARELALLQCSDWPFMCTRGRSPEYAEQRFAAHLARFDAALRAAAAGRADDPTVRDAAVLDPYPEDPAPFLDAAGLLAAPVT